MSTNHSNNHVKILPPGMSGRVVIVTGANSGLGFEVTKSLAEGGHDIIMACRCVEKGEAAAALIREVHPNCLLTVMKQMLNYMSPNQPCKASLLQLDLAYASSVRDFVETFVKLKRKLNVLINNAGMCLKFDDLTLRNTRERNEITMATNYLGPFLLTNLLLDYLIETSSIMGDGRIVNVTCGLHNSRSGWTRGELANLDMKNFQLQSDDKFNGLQAYKNSKLCNVLFTYKLAHNIRKSNVVCNAIDPGIVPGTQLYRHGGRMQRCTLSCCVPRARSCAKRARTKRKPALEIAELATSERFAGINGRYWSRGEQVHSSDESYVAQLQDDVWKLSCKLVCFKSANDDSFDDISLGVPSTASDVIAGR